jgi:hypothetical protein
MLTSVTTPARGASASIQYGEQGAVDIDEAGHAWHGDSPRFLELQWLPFSEPVDDVVFVKYISYPRSARNPQLGRMFCARTRAATLECVIDFAATVDLPRRVHRFKLPVTGGVHQLGVYAPFLPQGGPDKAICVTAASPTCWSFDWEGTRADRYTLDATAAETAALRIAPELRGAWQQAAPEVSPATIREVVATDRGDLARVVSKDANITVHCARLSTGELSCFGQGVYGELGDGTLVLSARATRPLGDAHVVDVAAAGHRICAVVDDGRVACWGEADTRIPFPPRTKTTPLPMCKLDRAASTAKFTADRSLAVQRAASCASGCSSRGRDACLGCVAGCTTVPYLFRHDEVCQEPTIDGLLAQRSEACFEPNQSPRWLTDAMLRDYAPTTNLALAPLFLAGITDAIGVTMSVPSLCVLRRGGVIACLDDQGKLVPSR